MTLSTAERQRKHRQRLKNQGLVRVQGWTTPERAALIKALIDGVDIAVLFPQAAPAVPKSTQRAPRKAGAPKITKGRDASPEERRAALQNHQNDVQTLLKQGKTPRQIASALTKITAISVSDEHLFYIFGSQSWWTAATS